MKNKIVYKYIGKVLIAFSILLLFPIFISIFYKERFISFLIPLLISLLLGLLLNSLQVKNKTLYARDGFMIVSLAWIIISILGALPFCIDLKLSFADAWFESVSGFTTTGATIFSDVENLGNNILFWRSFSHFIGGMGVLAFVMAIIPLSRDDKSMHVLKAEMPGPSVAKLVPSIKKTLFYLYSIYLGLTLLECIFLLIGGLNIFDSILISMSTAGTGGFSYLNTSLATFSIFNKYVVAIFMFLFGINFNIYFLVVIMKDIKIALKSEELKVYIFMYVISVIFILFNTYNAFSNLNEALVSSVFHVSSVMTSTGFSIGDINIYPTACRVIMLGLMLISACAGSTCGGFKLSRLLICFKTIKRDVLKIIHPNSVNIITFEGKKVEEETINNICTFLFLYFFLIVVIMVLISCFDNFSFEVILNSVFSTFANVGLCFGISDFSIFSDFSKIVLSIGMLLGRLEIFPLIGLISNLRK